MYYQNIQPIGQIKLELRRYSRHIAYMNLSAMSVIALLFIPFFLYYYYAAIILLIIIGFLSFGLGIYRLYCTYKLAVSFENLGLYYMSESPSAKRAGQMLKLSLLLSYLAGPIGYVFVTISYYRIAETFKELHHHGLYPKKESRLLFYSVIGTSVSLTLYFMSMFVFLLSFSVASLMVIVILFSISGIFSIGSYIANVVGHFRLSNDVLEILEQAPSTVIYQPYLPAPPGAVYQQPVYQPTPPSQSPPPYQQPSVKPTINESEKFFCPECGTQVEGTISFCPKCGINLDY